MFYYGIKFLTGRLREVKTTGSGLKARAAVFLFLAGLYTFSVVAGYFKRKFPHH